MTDEEDEMGRPNRFVTESGNTPWFFFNGERLYEVNQDDANLLLNLGLVKKQDPQVAVVGKDMMDRLRARFK